MPQWHLPDVPKHAELASVAGSGKGRSVLKFGGPLPTPGDCVCPCKRKGAYRGPRVLEHSQRPHGRSRVVILPTPPPSTGGRACMCVSENYQNLLHRYLVQRPKGLWSHSHDGSARRHLMMGPLTAPGNAPSVLSGPLPWPASAPLMRGRQFLCPYRRRHGVHRGYRESGRAHGSAAPETCLGRFSLGPQQTPILRSMGSNVCIPRSAPFWGSHMRLIHETAHADVHNDPQRQKRK